MLLSLQPFVGDLEEAAQRCLRRAGDADSGIAAELTALARSMAAAKCASSGLLAAWHNPRAARS